MEKSEADKVWCTDFFQQYTSLTNIRNHKSMEQSQRAPEIQPSKQRIKELPGRQINSAAVCAHNLEGQLHPGLHQKKSVCQVKGGDSQEDRVEVMVSTQE